MKYPEYIMKKLRLSRWLDEDDNSMDSYFDTMSEDKVFDEVLQWEGLLGWGSTIRGYILSIYGVDLEGGKDFED